MFDLNGNNISYNCVITKNIKIDDNHRLDRNKLRKLTNSKDILLLKEANYNMPVSISTNNSNKK